MDQRWRIINGPELIHEADVDGQLWAVELEHVESKIRRTVEVEVASSVVDVDYGEAEVRHAIEEHLDIDEPPGRWQIEASS